MRSNELDDLRATVWAQSKRIEELTEATQNVDYFEEVLRLRMENAWLKAALEHFVSPLRKSAEVCGSPKTVCGGCVSTLAKSLKSLAEVLRKFLAEVWKSHR